jgi:ADP-heptose:LPS heptosyltransferase
VIVLETEGIRWAEISRNAARLQDFDWVIAAKGGYSRSLALLTRLTNGPVRIGFAPEHGDASLYYTDPVPPPPNPHEEHQIETLLRLLHPLNIKKGPFIDLSLRLPQEVHDYALGILAQPPFAATHPFLLINLSSTVRLRFREEDFAELITRLLDSTQLIIGLVSLPEDQPKAIALATRMASERVVVLATPGPLEVAALIQRAELLITPEGGSAHLAATVKTPALVLWSEGPFGKWHSRADNHAYVQAAHDEKVIPLERVWAALQPMIAER